MVSTDIMKLIVLEKSLYQQASEELEITVNDLFKDSLEPC